MPSFVVATAGHVDHGKSALLRALTAIDPDRLAEEHRRGLTVDLGFAWFVLHDGVGTSSAHNTPDENALSGAHVPPDSHDGAANVAFVDVPGHERFLGNMLSGLGPAPVVCFVVAADEGWQAQSADHRDAIAALGIARGVVVLSKADRAGPEQIARVRDQVHRELAGTGLAEAPVVVCSALTGAGLGEFRRVLGQVLHGVPPAPEHARVRLWLDRSFSITGAGTVVTGTLTAGTLAQGQHVRLGGRGWQRQATVRALQSRGHDCVEVGPVSRVAVNLRGVAAEDLHRGDVLLTGDWPDAPVVDVRRVHGDEFGSAGERVSVHVGSAAVPGRLRAFDGTHGRLVLERGLPLVVGDRLVLQASGSRRVRAGVVVLDVAPEELRRRGAGPRRAAELAGMDPEGDPAAEVARRGAVRVADLLRWGVLGDEGAPLGGVYQLPGEVHQMGSWWVAEERYRHWVQCLRAVVAEAHERDPLAAGVSRGAVAEALQLPDPGLVEPLAAAAGLSFADGVVADPGQDGSLGPAEPAVAELVRRLEQAPFAAPEADELVACGLGPRELAAAHRTGRLLRLPGEVILLPRSAALAMRELAELPQPFTASAARQALGTTRRVMIPLLEHLDARGWTRRLADSRREVVR